MDEASFAAARTALANDRSQGAAAQARQALAVAEASALESPADSAAALQARLQARAAALAACRPAMTPVAVLPQAWARDVAALQPARGLTWLRRAAAALARERIDASRAAGPRAARRLAARLPAGARLLSLSDSTTVRALLVELARRDTSVSVIVAESRPACEGRRLARHSAQQGLATTLITEAQLGRAAATCDAAVVGADTVGADGSILNKTGSYPLALCAAAAGIPVYAVAESFKWRPAALPPPPIESGPADELGAVPANIAVQNVTFEWVPAHLVTAAVAER